MKIIKKINKYLIEHYPLIWNTRLVWMFTSAIAIHLLFFIIGYCYVNGQKDIEAHYNLSEFYYNTSMFLFGALLSIIILLIWVLYYVQNNAFKSFYPLKKGTLFTQFCILLTIIFLNTSQYYSFKFGLTTKIKNLYKWEEVDKDIKEFNKLSIFFLNDEEYYEIDNKMYPKPFPLSLVKTKGENLLGIRIDTTKSFFKFENTYYQFYESNEELKKRDIENKKLIPDIYGDYSFEGRKGFKYRIVHDVSNFKEHIKPNLYNYSKVLYWYGQDSITSEDRISWYEKVLNNKGDKEIEKHLKKFFLLAQKYNLDHNLKIKDWLYLINKKNNYQFKTPISSSKPISERILELVLNVDNENLDDDEDVIKINGEYYKRDYLNDELYLDLGNLDYYFRNIYASYHPLEDLKTLYIVIIFSFVLSLLLFLFKVTNIKTLLLSVVTGCILLIIGVMCIVFLSNYIKIYRANLLETSIILIILLLILGSSMLSFIKQWKKIITAILFSLAVFTIPLISIFHTIVYRHYIGSELAEKNQYLNWYNNNGFWFTILVWLVGIGLYTFPIRKWKGLSEK